MKHLLPTPIQVKPREEIEILVWISQDLAKFKTTGCYRSDNGRDFRNHDAEHKGLFELKESPNSHNCTCIDRGQIPEIEYVLRAD